MKKHIKPRCDVGEDDWITNSLPESMQWIVDAPAEIIRALDRTVGGKIAEADACVISDWMACERVQMTIDDAIIAWIMSDLITVGLIEWRYTDDSYILRLSEAGRTYGATILEF